jgi:hypothetical protein
MPIARKPKSKPEVSEKAITAVIEKGGSVPREKTAKGKIDQTVNIRMPEDILSEIDNSVASRRIKISRHTWLMEAIVEKLDRESAE